MPKCFALFSGGLDSALAIKVVQKAGVDVIALNFVSHFFGGFNEKIDYMCKQLNVPVLFVPFQEQQLAVTVTPVHGRGKNFNACIDCHAAMIRIAGMLMPSHGVDFIVTGEVLGQRPMSQNAKALVKVQVLSGFGDLLLRPLSAKVLPRNQTSKIVDIEKMLDIQGRSTARQESLAAEFQLKQYPTHGGGCLLTDVEFGIKMKSFMQDGIITQESQFVYQLMKYGRLLKLAPKQYILVGRDYQSNMKLMEYKGFCSYLQGVTPVIDEKNDLPGPTILLLDFSKLPNFETIKFQEVEIDFKKDIEDLQPGKCTTCTQFSNGYTQKDLYLEASQELIDFALKAYSFYCKGKALKDTNIEIFVKQNEEKKIVYVPAIGAQGGKEIAKTQLTLQQ